MPAKIDHSIQDHNLAQENHSYQIEDLSFLHKYRTEIPNILFELGLDPYELCAYLHFKKISGDRGSCFKSMKKLEQEMNMSEKKIREVKHKLSQSYEKLNNKPLIKVTKRKISDQEWTTDLIQIQDIWPENFLHFMKIKENLGGSQQIPPLVPDRNHPGSPRADKQEPLQEDPSLNKDNVCVSKDIERTLPPKIQKLGYCLDLPDKFKLTPDQTQTFYWLKHQGIDTDDGTLCWWAKNHSLENLENLILQAKKMKAQSIGAYVATLLKSGVKILVEEIERNRLWFIQAMKDLSFSAKVKKKYAILENGTEVDFNAPHNDFKQHVGVKLGYL